MNDKRERGEIQDVFVGKEDHGIETVSVGVSFSGGYQGFGQLCLSSPGAQAGFVRELCETFGVSKVDELKGRKCYALRNWSYYGAAIEGLESIDTGRRFTITGWRKRFGFDHPDPLAERRERLKQDAENFLRRAAEAEAQLRKLNEDFTDWETAP